MRLKQLWEDSGDSIAFCFGRMNPPTRGHKAVFDTLAKTNKNYRIFISPAQKPLKNNPLDFDTKIKFIRVMFPEHAAHVSADPGLNTIMAIAAKLYDEGYRKITFVGGSDRVGTFKELLDKYNGVEMPNGMYNFEEINVVTSGDRDPDDEGLAGISASGARDAARAGDVEAFTEITGAGKYAKQLYDAVRSGLKIKEEVNEGPLELNTKDPVVVISDPKTGKILDKMNLSAAAIKYRLGPPENVKQQLAHQNYTTIGNYVVQAPMTGQAAEAILVNDPEKGPQIRPDGGMGTWDEKSLVSNLSRKFESIQEFLKYGNYENIEYVLYKAGAMESMITALAQYNRFKQKQGKRPIGRGREIDMGKY